MLAMDCTICYLRSMESLPEDVLAKKNVFV